MKVIYVPVMGMMTGMNEDLHIPQILEIKNDINSIISVQHCGSSCKPSLNNILLYPDTHITALLTYFAGKATLVVLTLQTTYFNKVFTPLIFCSELFVNHRAAA